MNIGKIAQGLKKLKSKDPRIADIRNVSVTSNGDVVVSYRKSDKQQVFDGKLSNAEIIKKILLKAAGTDKAGTRRKKETVKEKVVKKVKKVVKKK